MNEETLAHRGLSSQKKRLIKKLGNVSHKNLAEGNVNYKASRNE